VNKHKIVFYILFTGLLFIRSLTAAQSSDHTFAAVAPDIFSNSFVRCFYKDSKGYLWLGTADGLMRYDGTHVYRYDHSPEQENSICHNYINAIIEDARHRLWIGTAQGISIYDRDKDNFTTLDSVRGIRNQLNNRYITALSFDRQGCLWIGTHEGGVNVFDPATLKFTYLVEDDKEGVSANYINALLCVDGQMWCGTKGGIKLFNTKDQSLVPTNFGSKNMPVSQVSQLLADNAGNIWLATVNGEVLKITPRNGYYTMRQMISGESVYGASWNSILTLCKDTRGNLWIGGENSGLNYYDTQTGKMTRYMADEQDAKKLASNSIRAVYVDDTGLTWIGTFNKGAYRVDNRLKKFTSNKQNPGMGDNFRGKHVRSFAEDAAGNVWLTVDEIGLSKIEAKSGKLEPVNSINNKLTNKYLTAMICDRHGDLWVGSVGRGIYRINPGTGDVKNYSLQSAGFGDDKVYCLYEDKRGTIWAGTSGSGLFYFDPEHERFNVLCETSKPDHIKQTAYVSSMEEDVHGVFWVATMYGLYALTASNDKQYDYTLYLPGNEPGYLNSAGIQTVYEDKNKTLWIGTTDNGLNIKDGSDSVFQFLRRQDGLASNTVRALVEDAAGNLWIAGNMGLSKYDKAAHSFTVYTRDDGLASNNFYNNACLRSSTGRLFFGGNNGFTSFYPDSIVSNDISPVVYLADLKINNQSVAVNAAASPLKKHISLTSSLELSYEQRSFTIDFVALNLGQSFKPEYCYRLKGFDKEWNCSTSGHSATYTNMDPGTYVFLVKASNGEGEWSEPPTQLEITIHPLIWKTWWAISLYLAFFAGIAYVLMKARAERMAMRHQLHIERLAREREHAVSESKTQFFTNISHEFRTPLSLILMPLESLLAEEEVPPMAKEKITSAYRSADRMMHLVNELMDFHKIESGKLALNLQYGELAVCIRNTASAFNDLADRRNIRFSVKQEFVSLAGWFDRDKLEKMLVNVLSNAFKFTRDGGSVTIIMTARMQIAGSRQTLSRCLELVVLDNGIGISKEELPHIFDKFYQAKSASKVSNPGTGIGLSWTKALVELHQGHIRAESTPEEQTRFTLTIPLDAEVYEREGGTEKSDNTVRQRAANLLKSNEPEAAPLGQRNDSPYILVVEDNEELRKYLVRALQGQFHVKEASDGLQGLEAAFQDVPDLIISDVLMPNKTGLELCQAVKADMKTSHIPVVLLTAKAALEDQISGIETGADLYITKPFSIRYLQTHIHHLIESRRKLYARFSQDVYLLPENCASNKMDQAFLERVVNHILTHLQDSQLSVDSLAEVFNLSRVQVYRKIKALTGKTAVEFIRSVRLKQALKLMETKQYTLSEIAYRSGFNSASYFTRTFKEAYGKAPSEYLGVSG
jgi:ligand-binding sensor domain-containing protein/signal transduction histidine kinase/DNA-binding response OmpR family regulator